MDFDSRRWGKRKMSSRCAHMEPARCSNCRRYNPKFSIQWQEGVRRAKFMASGRVCSSPDASPSRSWGCSCSCSCAVATAPVEMRQWRSGVILASHWPHTDVIWAAFELLTRLLKMMKAPHLIGKMARHFLRFVCLLKQN